eukprot:TRINITY_DN2951_c0_g1_i4.p1 TRINITY_DN2951_c0_g1~~TRINITY_DN2951_c0_g1_i4.p1  ORF type:complete len:670 (+),score=225.35 TRINITY_DN2951_c0_g1_i4:159-2168(+)
MYRDRGFGAAQVHLKAYYKDRAWRVGSVRVEDPDNLDRLIRKVVLPLNGSTPVTHPLRITYTDPDGTVVEIDSAPVLETALNLQTLWRRKADPSVGSRVPFLLEVHVYDADASVSAEAAAAAAVAAVVHTGVRCDVCSVCPIVGTRYKCAVRDDFDLCARCEAAEVLRNATSTERPEWVYLKIDRPQQAPAAITVVLRAEGRDTTPVCVSERFRRLQAHAAAGQDVADVAACDAAAAANAAARDAPAADATAHPLRDAMDRFTDAQQQQVQQQEGTAQQLTDQSRMVAGLAEADLDAMASSFGYGSDVPTENSSSDYCKTCHWLLPAPAFAHAPYVLERFHYCQCDHANSDALTDDAAAETSPSAAARTKRAPLDAAEEGQLSEAPSDPLLRESHEQDAQRISTAASDSPTAGAADADAAAAPATTDDGSADARQGDAAADALLATSIGQLALSMSAYAGGAPQPDAALSRFDGSSFDSAASPAALPPLSVAVVAEAPAPPPLAPGAPFVKAWTLRNGGATPLPADTRLDFMGGNLMDGPRDGVVVGAQAPLALFRVALPLSAPPTAGHWVGFWQCSAGGRAFGDGLVVDVHVEDGAASAAAMGFEDSDDDAWSIVSSVHGSEDGDAVAAADGGADGGDAQGDDAHDDDGADVGGSSASSTSANARAEA